MEWAAFGLARDPFTRGAELDDACLPNSVSALLSELLASLRSPQGVTVLAGESGSGKSMLAGALARRAGGSAGVAVLWQPTSSAAAIARDALAQLDPDDFDFSVDEDWLSALRAHVERATRAGRSTVVLLDDAHRLSPQTLADLTECFGEDERQRLHLFLFGRPKLLDRLQAGADETLSAHLLQICRLEPVGVRESVRYLERRLAICGGELATIFSDEAIDEVVQRSEGCLVRLEELAVEAMRRAARRGSVRATVTDVVATARHAAADEEDEVMATDQQPLRFQLEDEAIDEEEASWGDDDERSVEWGDEPADEDEGWKAEDDDEGELTWDTASPELEDDDFETEEEEVDDAGDGDDDEPIERRERAAASRPPRATSERRSWTGPAMLSLGACFALVWAANNMPGPEEEEPRSRDAVLFAERLSSKPEEIMRLARTVEAADADAHVHVWKDQPPRPVATADAKGAKPGAEVADADPPLVLVGDELRAAADKPAAKKEKPAAAKAEVAKAPARPTASQSTRPAATASAKPASKPATTAAAKATKPAATAAASRKQVYTVQLGAFKARRNAEEMVTKLRGKSPRILEEGGLYRVVSGSFGSKKDAVLHEASLRRAGYTTYVRTAVF